MIKRIAYYLLTLLTITAFEGCTDHRDLHVVSKPMFIIKNDWSVCQLSPKSATAMIFPRPDPCERMHSDASRHKLYLESEVYNVLVFNEVMFSPDVTNLDGILYRGTDKYETFGAYVKPSQVSPIFRSELDDIMVGYSYPEPLATRTYEEKQVLSEKEYVMKYQNGVNGFPVYGNFEADSVELCPIRVTRDVKVVAHVINLKNQLRVSATLRGFAEGVLLSSRRPHGSNASYVFDLNSAVPDPEVEGGHIIVSKPFTTFGPWWNDYPGDHKYMIDFVATKGDMMAQSSFDVTESNGVTVTKSVGEAIVKIKDEEAQFLKDGTPPKMDLIVIEVWFELPDTDDFIDVGVVDWGSDIIIPIPMNI